MDLNKTSSKIMEEFTCKECGLTFMRNINIDYPAVTCSKECYDKRQIRIKRFPERGMFLK